MHARAHPAPARLTPPDSDRGRRQTIESPGEPSSRLRGKKGWLAGLLIGIALPALAQFDTAPPSRTPRPALATMATTEAAYRIDGARHIYLNHPERIHDGLLPPTLIASIYGMNFQYMPELSQKWGYPLALCLMLLSIVTPFWFFRRKGWLK